MEIEISGYSDDLVNIDGDFSEELDSFDEKATLLFSDGTILEIEYTDEGIWAITVKEQGTASLTKTPNTGPDSEKGGYSDKMKLVGEINWIYHVESKLMIKPKRELKKK
jgi:hypothetical protein